LSNISLQFVLKSYEFNVVMFAISGSKELGLSFN